MSTSAPAESPPPPPATAVIATHLQPNVRHFDVASVVFPHFSRPTPVGCFSVDGQRRPHQNDRRFLNFVHMWPPSGKPNQPSWFEKVHIDLNRGMQQVIRKPPEASNEKLDHLLAFIVDNLQRLRQQPQGDAEAAPDKLLRIDIVCFRGLLRLLMCTPYETRSGWSILACRWRGNIYLCRWETEAELAERQKNERTPQMCRMFSYGFKLEQHLATRQRYGRPNVQAPVNEAEEFCCMFETRLGSTRLLYGAEMDGVAEDQQGDIDLDATDLSAMEFAEIKVHRGAQNQRQEEAFYRNKSRNWWAQSFLVGVQRIVVGERNDSGVVGRLYEWKTADLERESRRFWSAAVCTDFCSRFLELVRDSLADTDSLTEVCRFDYDPRRSEVVSLQRLDGADSVPYRFLPQWYVDGVQNPRV